MSNTLLQTSHGCSTGLRAGNWDGHSISFTSSMFTLIPVVWLGLQKITLLTSVIPDQSTLIGMTAKIFHYKRRLCEWVISRTVLSACRQQVWVCKAFLGRSSLIRVQCEAHQGPRVHWYAFTHSTECSKEIFPLSLPSKVCSVRDKIRRIRTTWISPYRSAGFSHVGVG